MNKHKRFGIICLYLVSMASIVCHAHDLDTASLIQQLEHTDVDVQSVYESLIEMGEAAVPALIVGLDHENTMVRAEVLSLLRIFILENEIPPNHKDFKIIVRAIVKALKDDESGVRLKAMECFLGKSVTELPPKLAAEVISGFAQLLHYGSPYFDVITFSVFFIASRDSGRAALDEALHSSEWPLRFGAAIAYGYVLERMHLRRFIQSHQYIKPLPKAVVPILFEELTNPVWKIQDDAARVLIDLELRHCRICEHTDEVRKTLEALPPFGIISQTIRDGDDVDAIHTYQDPGFLDSLNTGWHYVQIQPLNSRLLDDYNQTR